MPKPAPALKPRVERRFHIIIWAAFLVSIAVYYVVMRLVRPASPLNDLNVALVLNAVAVVLVGLSFLAKRRMSFRAAKSTSQQAQPFALIIPLAMCDAAALLGLIAWFLTASPLSYYPLLFGFGGVGLHFPMPPAEDD